MYRLLKDKKIVNKRDIIFIVFGFLLSTLALYFVPYASKYVLDNIINNQETPYLYMIIIFLLGAFMQTIIFYFGNYQIRRMLLVTKEKLLNNLFIKSLDMPTSDYLKQDTGKIHNLYYGDVGNLSSSIVNYKFLLPGFLIQLLLTLAVLFYMNPILTLFSLISLPLYLYFVVWNVKRRTKLNQICIDAYDNLVKNTNNYKDNISSIKMTHKNEFFRDKFAYYLHTDVEASKKFFFWLDLGNRIPEFIKTIFPVLIMFVGGKYVHRDLITVGSLVMFAQLSSYLFEPLTAVFHGITEIKSMKPFYDRYESFLYMDSNEYNKYNQLFEETDKITISGSEIKTMDGKKLYDADLSLSDKGLYIIKGPNGSGKTTILKILAGIYGTDQITGLVKIPQKYKDNISFLQYPLFLFNGTIKENIVYDKNKEIKYSDKFKLPDLEKQVNSSPINLSSGEAQKVALLRVLNEDRKVLFLDEPMSNLEKEAMQSLKEILKDLSKEKLIITIMHDDSLDDIKTGEIKINNNKMQ